MDGRCEKFKRPLSSLSQLLLLFLQEQISKGEKREKEAVWLAFKI